MNPEPVLHTMAQIGVALAGFVALVAIFRRADQSSWKPQVLGSVRYMIELSLALVILALLPSTLVLLGVSSAELWFYMSVLFLGVSTTLFTLNLWRFNRLLKTGWRPRTFAFHIIGGLLTVGAVAIQGFNVAVGGSAGLYVSGLLILIVLIVIPFLALVSAGGSRDLGDSR